MSGLSPLHGRRCWVVGASSGIGAALADELRARGARVAVSARRREALEEVAGTRMLAVPVDAADRASVAEAATAVADGLGGIDMVVWCAGHWEQFDAATWDADVFEQHVRVNLLGLNNLLAAVVPPMVARGAGHVVGVASVAGYRGLPGSEAYGATKAAQINLLEALRGALQRRGVRVTTVCPGFVRTPMTARNTFPMPFMVEADEAARAIADGLEAERATIVFPWPMAVLMGAARLLPARLWTLLTRSRAPRRSGASDGPSRRSPAR
ncbi:MAG: SDR family NAD(P)-dependent oxidoreductase [Nocardioides sp.]|uniref:SDR family NAD(P)-dependent oxidoreductase n=1 Tax=Nocardioides sp. TaxID=35761 RepID=UPI003EFC0314